MTKTKYNENSRNEDNVLCLVNATADILIQVTPFPGITLDF